VWIADYPGLGLLRARIPIVLLVAAMAASGSFLVALGSHLSFAMDGWQVLIGRPDWSAGTFLNPFHEQLIIGLAMVYKVLLVVFGMDSALPFFAVSTAAFLLVAALLFAYLRRRVGEWAALIGAVLVLFLGAASEDLLWAFQIGYFASVAAGLGMLLALDREDRRSDRIAAALLAISIAFSSIGIAFAAAAAVHIALGPRPRLRRAFVALLPLLAYAVWWLGWGRMAGTHLTSAQVVRLPEYLFEAASAGVASLMGVEPEAMDGRPPPLAEALVAIAVVLGAARFSRRRVISRGVLVALTLMLTFWVLTGLAPGRLATSSRYQYPSAVFILIVAAEAMRGVRLRRPALWAATIIACGAVFGGVSLTERAYTHVWKPMGERNRATLAAVDIVGTSARPGFRVAVTPKGVTVRTYLAVRKRHGSPAFSERELLRRPGPPAARADQTIAAALGLRLERADATGRLLACRTIRGDGSHGSVVRLRPGHFEIESPGRSAAYLQLGRFSDRLTVTLGTLPAGAARSLSIPADESSRAWRLGATGGPVRICQAERTTEANRGPGR
jgi:hypothetical protein